MGRLHMRMRSSDQSFSQEAESKIAHLTAKVGTFENQCPLTLKCLISQIEEYQQRTTPPPAFDTHQISSKNRLQELHQTDNYSFHQGSWRWGVSASPKLRRFLLRF